MIGVFILHCILLHSIGNVSRETNDVVVMREIISYAGRRVNATLLKSSSDVGLDFSSWVRAGVPGMVLLNENEKYFYFHHTEG